MTIPDLGLGDRCDVIRRNNLRHNTRAILLREYPIICSQCNNVMGYTSIDHSHGMCGVCKIKALNSN